MRGPKTTALAVRNTRGEIVTEEFETKGVKRPAFCKLPVIRGIFGYIDSMTVGYKCLMRSAELSGLEDVVEENPKKKKKREEAQRKVDEARAAEASYEGSETEKMPAESAKSPVVEPAESPVVEEAKSTDGAEPQKKEEEKLPSWVMTALTVVSILFGVALCVGLFIYLPAKLYAWLSPHVAFFTDGGAGWRSLWKSVFEGVVKIILLVAYMAAVSLMKDIRRTYMYHGAEHKTIFCYEAGLELTVENVRRQGRFHPRCGTSFLILMLLVSIFISFFIDPIAIAIGGDVLPTVLRVLVKLLLIPLIVGLGYELIKFAGRHDNLLTKIISAPGVWLQHVTVLEPTDDMIECAITAVKKVIPNDESDKW